MLQNVARGGGLTKDGLFGKNSLRFLLFIGILTKKKRRKIMKGIVAAICIRSVAGEPMQTIKEAEAMAGMGLKGDCYATGQGSFSGRKGGNRQVTLINAEFFSGSGFSYTDSRRNIVTIDVELMGLIGKEFQIGTARFRGIGYCDPCSRPSKLAGKERDFKEAFFDRGGLAAEIIESGIIKIHDQIIPLP